ncbi:MAG: hypothetical protein TREMPRED_001474 [Tremellales sp. Tagirdzhanova-0007]|nr:MAG: hypothetical protein TREMPRED_001474 [Tremellales sp. Tagirdzhanova-0007]
MSQGKANLRDWPVPSLAPNEVLVKVIYAASNPTDVSHRDYLSPPDVPLGADFSGTVAALGSSVSRLKIGDRVSGSVHGGKFKDKGAFAEYLKQEETLLWIVPEQVKMEEAAGTCVGLSSAAMAIYLRQGVPMPPAKRTDNAWYIVQGGSSSVGLYAVQLARLAGYRVIATCSPHSFDLVKSYGADQVVDYHDAAAALEQIKSVTADGVVAGLECIGGMPNIKLAKEAFGPKGGLLITLGSTEGLEDIRPDVKAERILLYTAGGVEFEFYPGKPKIPAMPEDRVWYLDFVKAFPSFFTTYGVKANPVDLRHGMESIQAGMEELKAKKVSGKKITYKIG